MADWNSALSGATGGATAGSAFGPTGALIGGAIGGLTGLFGGSESDPTADWAKAVQAAGNTYNVNQRAALSPYEQLTDVAASKDALAAYRKELESYDPAAYTTTGGGQLTYNDPRESWQSYLDPSMDLAISNATGQAQESAAGRGGLYAGDTQKEIAKVAADTSMGYAQNAMNMAASEGQKQTNTQAHNWDQLISQNQANSGIANQRASNLVTSYNATMVPLEQYISGLSDLNRTIYGGATGVANQKLQSAIGAQGQPSTWDQIAGLTNVASKYLR